MNDATFEVLPPLPRDLAEGAVRTLKTVLERIPDQPLKCCFVGNWTTDAFQLLEFNDISPENFQFPAAVVRQHVTKLDAEYVMTVLDIAWAASRTVSVSIETRDATYASSFPVVPKGDGSAAMALGPGRFERLRKHTSPFARMLRRRSRC
ncbi:hypothetical protein ACS5PN_11335 [Roseateles sp. NT4]|uniref:hypothetical protein n=1 Tax=Roseateles sp. NT4 TaxID=3453715 RepID=UPI003EF048FA